MVTIVRICFCDELSHLSDKMLFILIFAQNATCLYFIQAVVIGILNLWFKRRKKKKMYTMQTIVLQYKFGYGRRMKFPAICVYTGVTWKKETVEKGDIKATAHAPV